MKEGSSRTPFRLPAPTPSSKTLWALSKAWLVNVFSESRKGPGSPQVCPVSRGREGLCFPSDHDRETPIGTGLPAHPPLSLPPAPPKPESWLNLTTESWLFIHQMRGTSDSVCHPLNPAWDPRTLGPWDIPSTPVSRN